MAHPGLFPFTGKSAGDRDYCNTGPCHGRETTDNDDVSIVMNADRIMEFLRAEFPQAL